MKFILAFALFLASVTSPAWTLKEVVKRNSSNELARTFQVTCSSADLFCSELCQSQSDCEVSQDSCLGCLSDTDLVVRSVLLDADRIYEVSAPPMDSNQIIFLFSRGFSLLTPTSSANVFSDPRDSADDARIRAKFQSLCPLPTQNPIIILTDLTKAVVCEDQAHNSLIYPLGIRNEFQKH